MIAKRTWQEPQYAGGEWPHRQISDNLILLNRIALMLEQTPKPQSVSVVCDTPEDARDVRRAVYQMSRRHLGKGAISFCVGLRAVDGKPALFARRGPNWGKNSKADKKGDAS